MKCPNKKSKQFANLSLFFGERLTTYLFKLNKDKYPDLETAKAQLSNTAIESGYTDEFYRRAITDLSTSLGLEVKWLSDIEMSELHGPNKLGATDGSTIWLNIDRYRPTTFLHELSHIWLKQIEVEDPELFNKISQALIASKINSGNVYEDFAQTIEAHYKKTTNAPQAKFMSIINNLYNKVLKYLYKLFGVYDPSLTLKEAFEEMENYVVKQKLKPQKFEILYSSDPLFATVDEVFAVLENLQNRIELKTTPSGSSDESHYIDNVSNEEYIRTTKLIQDDKFIEIMGSYTSFDVEEWKKKKREEIINNSSLTNEEKTKKLYEIDKKAEFFKMPPEYGGWFHTLVEIGFNDPNADVISVSNDLDAKGKGLPPFLSDPSLVETLLQLGKDVRSELENRFKGKKVKFLTETALIGPEFTDELKKHFGVSRPAGKLDIIAVVESEDGTAEVHVFDYKFSNKEYDSWSVRKLENIRYQQALYQAFLKSLVIPGNKKIKVNKYMNIISIPYETDFEIKLIAGSLNDVRDVNVTKIGKYRITQTSLVPEHLKLKQLFKEYNPVSMSKHTSEDLKAINQIFVDLMDYSIIKSGLTSDELDKIVIKFISQKQSPTNKFYNTITRTEEELTKENVRDYFLAIRELQSEVRKVIIEAWNQAKKSFSYNQKTHANFVYTRSLYIDQYLNELFRYYLEFFHVTKDEDGNEVIDFAWDILDSGDDILGDELGVIVFYNKHTHQAHVISINHEPNKQLYGENGDTIFAKHYPNKLAEKSQNGFEATTVNVGLLKGAMYALHHPDLTVETVISITGNAINYSDVSSLNKQLEAIQKLFPSNPLLKKRLEETNYVVALVNLLNMFLDKHFNIQPQSGKASTAEFLKELEGTIKQTASGLTVNYDLAEKLIKARLVHLNKIVKINNKPPLSVIEEITLLSKALTSMKKLAMFQDHDLFSSFDLGVNKVMTLASDIPHAAIKEVMALQYRADTNIQQTVIQMTRELKVRFDAVEKMMSILKPTAFLSAKLFGIRENVFLNLEQYHQDANGKWVRSFMFRDPDNDEPYLAKKPEFQTALTEEEKELLREILKVLNSLPSRKNLTGSRRLEIPLVKGTSMSKFKKDVKNKGILEAAKELLYQELNPDKDPNWDKSLEHRQELVSMLQHQASMENRLELLSQNDPEDFETDVQTYLYLAIVNEIKTIEYNKILPEILAIRYALTLSNFGIFNLFPETIKYLDMLFRTNIRQERGVHKDEEKMFSKTAVINRVATDLLIGFNPDVSAANVLNNLFNTNTAMQGLMKNRLSYKNLYKAFVFMTTNSWRTIDNINFINALNEYFGVYEMSVPRIADTLKTGEKGFRQFEHYMHFLNQAPDFFFRMVLFIGEMLEEGVLELTEGNLGVSENSAISYKNDMIVYDPKKDKRISKFTNNMTNDPDYEKQKSLAEAMMKDMGTDKLIVPYSWREIKDKLKRADMIYQNTDPASRSWFEKTAWGNMFIMFKRWIQARYNLYFRPPQINEFVGRYEQRFENGKWITEWKGRPMEGIFMSIKSFIRMAIKYKSLTAAGKNLTPEQIDNLKMGAMDLIQFILATVAASAIIEGIKDDEEEKYKRRLAKVLYNSSSALMFFNPFMEKSLYTSVGISYMLDRVKKLLSTLQKDPEHLPFEIIETVRFVKPVSDAIEEEIFD